MNKCMYAGKGGVACLADEELAARIREMRGAWTAEDSARNRLRDQLGVAARSLIRTRLLHRLGGAAAAGWRRLAARRGRRETAAAAPVDLPAALSAEWTHLMTPLNRKLAMHNLRCAKANADIRRRQAEIYVACLKDCSFLRSIDVDALPQSHFPIRVDGDLREPLRRHLRKCGIDTDIDFPFPAGLEPSNFPNSLNASEEVLTLPMGERLGLDDVKMISQCVLRMFAARDA
jgi:dTDP-4-amino-4,6-dideoxygalactose transaminase